MQFSYKVITKDGKTEEGTREAADKFALGREFSAGGATVITIEPITELEKSKHFSLNPFGRVSLEEKIVFSKNLAAMLDAGLSVSRALTVLERQTRTKKFQNVLHAVSESVRQGKTLSQSMASFTEVFPVLFVSMVRAGEESGRLGESLRLVAGQMDRSYALRRKVRGAMMYPAIVISAMIVIGILMFIFVVPTITATFIGLNIELPLTTRMIIWLSDFISGNLVLFLGTLFVLIAGTVWGFRTERGKVLLSTLTIHLPILKGIVRETNAAQTTRTLSSLLTSGVPVVDALRITKDVLGNVHYRAVLDVAGDRIQKGSQISAVFAEHEELYPPMVGEMIAVGEETGKLPDMLLQVASFFEDSVEEKTKDLSTVIEPVLMIFIGVVVGFFALAVLSPTYSLVNAIS